MPKYTKRRRRGFGSRFRRGIRKSKRSSPSRRLRQGAFRNITRKYIRVYYLNCDEGEKSSTIVISHFGGQGVLDNGRVVCVTENDQASNMNLDASRYQQCCITGVGYKIWAPRETADTDFALSFWSIAYSPSEIIPPGISDSALQTLNGYQCGNSTGMISRYHNTAKARKSLGIDWMTNSEIMAMNNGAVTLYNG